MTSVKLPKLQLEDEFDNTDEFDSAQSTFKGLQPGTYEVVISDVGVSVDKEGNVMLAKDDKSWFSITLTLESMGKTIKHFLKIPTKRTTYGKDKKRYTWVELVTFAKALGIELTLDNYKQIIAEYFYGEGLAKLKGCHLKIDVGYRGRYAEYQRKEGDNAIYFIKDPKTDQYLIGEDGAILEFASKPAAIAYAETNEFRLEQYVNVLHVGPSVTPNSFDQGETDDF